MGLVRGVSGVRRLFAQKKMTFVVCCCLIRALHPLSCVASFVLFKKRYELEEAGGKKKRGIVKIP